MDVRADMINDDPRAVPWSKMPLAVCLAFAAARTPDDVFAVLRYHRKFRMHAMPEPTCDAKRHDENAIDYLMGCNFPEAWNEDFDTFKEIQEHAWEWLAAREDQS